MSWNITLPDAEYYAHGDPGMDSLVREIEDQKEVAIDTETDGLTLWRCKAYYWSLSWKSGLRTRRVCMPSTTLPYFRQAFNDWDKTWVFANAKFDVHMIANCGIDIQGRLADTSVMHALLYEEMPHGLKEMAYQTLGWKWTDFEDTFGSLRKGTCICGANEKSHKDGGFCKKTSCMVFRQVTSLDRLERAAAQAMGQLVDYASNDAYGTWELYLELKRQLEAEETWGLYTDRWPKVRTLADYFFNLEVPFTRVLYTCERNGMKVDRRYLEDLAPKLVAEAEDIRKEIVQLAGYLLNPDSPPQLQKYFYEDLKLPVTKRTKGGKTGVKKPSTDKDYLESIEDDVPMAALILKLRHVQKQLGTYVEELPNKLDPNDRIHARINQDIARTGRLSAQDGMHQIPTGEKDTYSLRKAFIAEKGKKIIGGDFSQLEMRLLAGGSMEEKMCDIFRRGWDIHMGNAALMYGVPYDDIVTAKKIDKAVKEGKSPAGALTDYYLKCLFQRQAAKCVHPDTLVWAEGGPKRIANLGPFAKEDDLLAIPNGENILTGSGSRAKVTHTYNGGVKRLLHVVTRRGVLTCSETHKILTKEAGLVRAGDLVKGMHPIQPRLPALGAGQYQLIPVRYKDNAPTLYVKVGHEHAYLAGIYLGDGTVGGNSLGVSHGPDTGVDQLGTAYDEWQAVILDAARAIGLSPIPKHRSVRLGDALLCRIFTDLELLKGDKRNLRIPSWVLSAGREAILHFLGGLLDTDGTVVKGSVSVTTKDAVFAGQIATVMHGLGLRFSVEPSWNKTYERFYYRIRVMVGDSSVFKPYMRHPGKLVRFHGTSTPKPRLDDEVLLVTDAGFGPCVDITVGSEQHLYIANNYITHNTIGFGLIYGMREKKLARSLGVTLDEAIESRERYLNTYPAIGAFTDEAVTNAREDGAAYTILGRRRRLPDIWSTHDMDRWAAERQAVNTVIQGSAADTCKLAMLLIYDERLDKKYGCDMLFQVHDEILFECPDEHVEEVKPLIKEWMEHPFPSDLAVPLEVDIGHGQSWGTAK